MVVSIIVTATIMSEPSHWQLLIVSLPSNSTTLRVRIWRALKVLGCAPLRDGAYLLPCLPSLAEQLRGLSDEVTREKGTAWLVGVHARSEQEDATYRSLFDRRAEYQEWRETLVNAGQALGGMKPQDIQRSVRKLRRDYEALLAIDYFPNDASAQASAAWAEFVRLAELRLSPGEPQSRDESVERRDPFGYRGRVWATRRRLWVDRVASAWLIRRFIDGEARFLWLETPSDCPVHAVGFDFDGAEFTHVGPRVTFEVLAAAFGLDEDPALKRLGAMVRALDVGQGFLPEACGFEAMLAGARQRHADDNALLAEIGGVLDSPHAYFSTDPTST
jgi:hypothetical protein